MSKHTPGPWVVDEAQPGDLFHNVVRGEGDSFGVLCRTSINGNANAEADARLIAAAPELLEALRIAQAFMSIASDWNIDEAEINGETRSTYDWLEVVDSAIAKATGETP
jgi:hypothetical protein